MTEVNWNSSAVSQAIEGLSVQQLTSCIVNAHTKIVIQSTVDPDIEATGIRVREEDHGIFIQLPDSFRTIDNRSHDCTS